MFNSNEIIKKNTSYVSSDNIEIKTTEFLSKYISQFFSVLNSEDDYFHSLFINKNFVSLKLDLSYEEIFDEIKKIDIRMIEQVRIFNEKYELFILRKRKNIFNARFIIELKTKLVESEKLKLQLRESNVFIDHFKLKKMFLKNKKEMGVIVKNYFYYDDHGMINFYDYRLISIKEM